MGENPLETKVFEDERAIRIMAYCLFDEGFELFDFGDCSGDGIVQTRLVFFSTPPSFVL